MPKCDPWDTFFYPPLTAIIDIYILTLLCIYYQERYQLNYTQKK